MAQQPSQWMQIRRLATDIIGFHDLLENGPPLATADRVRYEAIVYASGVTLATKLAARFAQD